MTTPAAMVYLYFDGTMGLGGSLEGDRKEDGFKFCSEVVEGDISSTERREVVICSMDKVECVALVSS
jgi:hypothetical protein